MSLNAIHQLAEVSYQPVWGITMFAVDVFILYALVVYGEREGRCEIRQSGSR